MTLQVLLTSPSASTPDSRGPAPSIGAQLRISGIFVGVMASVLQQRGIAADALLGVRSRLEAGEPREWLSLREFSQVFQRAMTLTAEPALGLLCGATAIEPSYALIGTLVAHARTLRRAVELARQYHPLVIEGATLHFSERMGRGQLLFDFPRVDSLLDRGLAELGAAGLWRMLRAFGAPAAAIHRVMFTHRKPHYHDAYHRVFSTEVRFEAECAGIEFDSSLLDRPHLHYQPDIQALLQAQAERRLAQLSGPPSFVERVHWVLSRQARKPDMLLAARELGLSVRTLRRRLVEEGSSYREVTQLALRDAACAMLRDPESTVQATSHALGFARDTAFHRAFKRWTGMTATQYRELAVSAGRRSTP